MLNYQDLVRSIKPKNLLGYYPLDEISGSTAYDRSGNGYNFTYAGVTLGDAESIHGKPCPYFDGTSSDYVEGTSSGILADINTTLGSMHGWMKVYNSGVWSDEVTRYLTQIEHDGDNRIHIIKRGGGASFYNKIQLLYEGQTDNSYNSYDTTALNNNLDWIHCAVTWDETGDEVNMYVNGILVDTDSFPTEMDTPNDIQIGNEESGGGYGNPFYGWLSDVAYYDVVLSQALIQQFCIGRLT